MLWGLASELLGGSALLASGDMLATPGDFFADLTGPLYGMGFFAARLGIGIFTGIVLAFAAELDDSASWRSLKLAAKCAGASLALSTLIVVAAVSTNRAHREDEERDAREHRDDFSPFMPRPGRRRTAKPLMY